MAPMDEDEVWECAGSRCQPKGRGEVFTLGVDDIPVEPDAAAAAAAMKEASGLAEAGSFAKAAEVFGKAGAFSAGPDKAVPLEARAQCMLELDRFDEAAEYAQRATEARPEWPAGYATLGRTLLNAGRLQDAAETLARARELAAAAAEAATATPADRELAEDLAQDAAEAQQLLLRHWAEHHDMLLPAEEVCDTRLIIRQSFDCGYCNLNGGEGPGGAVWAAGAMLAEQIMTKPPPACVAAASGSWRDLRVLDLGSGTGVAGLAAAAVGAEVLLTDREDVVPLTRMNCAINSHVLLAAGGRVGTCAYDWLDPPPAEVCKPWDVVLAADVIYAFAAVEPFVEAVDAVVAKPDGEGGVGAPLLLHAHFSRSDDLDAELAAALAKRGLFSTKLGRPGAAAVGRINQEAMDRIELNEIRRLPAGEAVLLPGPEGAGAIAGA